MSRPRKHDTHLPKGVYLRSGSYYRVRDGRWTRIGKSGPDDISFPRSIPAYQTEMREWCRRLLARARANAKGRRSLPFSLTKDDIDRMLDECGWQCRVSGATFSLERVNGAYPLAPSIDRIDCSLGYAPDNCRLVCAAVNFAMNRWGESVLWRLFDKKQHLVLEVPKLPIE